MSTSRLLYRTCLFCAHAKHTKRHTRFRLVPVHLLRYLGFPRALADLAKPHCLCFSVDDSRLAHRSRRCAHRKTCRLSPILFGSFLPTTSPAAVGCHQASTRRSLAFWKHSGRRRRRCPVRLVFSACGSGRRPPAFRLLRGGGRGDPDAALVRPPAVDFDPRPPTDGAPPRLAAIDTVLRGR